MAEPILIAQHAASPTETLQCFLLPALANRHGLITGATGTGKTVTLQTLAESFSRRGVPVFMADVKGDLAGITQPGQIGEVQEQEAVVISNLEYHRQHAFLSVVEIQET